MKKKLTALLAVLALSLSLAPAALAAGEAEPNNDYTTATSIRVNETVNGSFTPSGRNGDSDWYKFTLDEPGRVVFSFEAPSRIYFTGSLRCADEKGDLKEIYHDYFNGLPNAVSDTISHEAVPLFLDKGTYYLCLYADSFYEGAYTLQAGYTPLSAGSLEYEPNNDYTKATPIDLNTAVSGSFTPIRDNDENDWYRFTMPAPGRLDLSVTAPSGVSFSLHLNGINEKGALEQVYQQTFSGSHNSTTATVNHTAESVYLSAGTYYLQFWADSSYEGAYTFQAKAEGRGAPVFQMDMTGTGGRAAQLRLTCLSPGQKGRSLAFSGAFPGPGTFCIVPMDDPARILPPDALLDSRETYLVLFSPAVSSSGSIDASVMLTANS